MSLGISEEQYNALAPDEKLAVEQILSEISSNGQQGVLSSLEELYYADYDEIPVDFLTFLKDDNYLGKTTKNGSAIYPFWQNEGAYIFSRSDINEVAVSGSIGTGKSTFTTLLMAYHLYKTMCMRDPQGFFGLTPGSEITYAFLNNTLASSEGVGYKTLQAFIQESPWFLKHGKLVGRNQDEYQPEKGFGFIVGSKPQHTIGRHIICAMIDEVSFSQGQNVNYEKSKIMELYTNIRRRMESRFMVQGHMYGLLFLVSSKATESSFLEAYIADQVKKNYPIYVIDQPLWKIKPAAYSGKFFKVAVGNKYLPSRIIRPSTVESEKDQVESYEKQGLKIIDVPIEHLQAFDQDIDKALQDIAGISTAVVTKAFNSDKVISCISKELVNPFKSEVISLGLRDTYELKDFFDVSRIPDNVKGAPMFIHLDASVKGDKTGLSGVAIIGSTKVKHQEADLTMEESQELIFQQVFSVGIQAPSDSEISFEKTRKFIYYLKDEVGLNIKLISTDGFQSVDTRQILTSKGYQVAYTSLDRTPDPYDSLRSAIYDKRIILLDGCPLLLTELTDLEKDNMTFKYDHPLTGSKDIADSLGGAYWDALQYKDEFLYWNPSEYDYDMINETTNEQEQLLNSFKDSLVGHKVVSSPKEIINESPTIYDNDILIW